tara:strand:- start:80 stop:841 length:762 start_codon:yes stop_codon:yes gene_type:complete
MSDTVQKTMVTLRSISGDDTKRKLSPPIVTGDPDLQRIVEKIYDDINEINGSVNQQMASNTDYTGKQGDIRVVSDPEDPKKQLLQGFGLNGWANFAESNKTIFRGKISDENKHSSPDYDSGWFNVSAAMTAKTLNHNLKTNFFKMNVFFRFTGEAENVDYENAGETQDGSDNVRTGDVHHLNLPNIYNYSSHSASGFGIVSKTTDTVDVWVGNNGVFGIDNYMSGDSVVVKKGQMRIILHKIPLGKKGIDETP